MTRAPRSSERSGARRLESCLYEGRVRHRRHAPVVHEFEYGVYFLYFDLAELPTLFRGRWLWSSTSIAPVRWHRSDHLGEPRVPLDTAVRDLVERDTGSRPTGPIRLLTQPRHLGYGFNPVSFYYCFDESGETVRTIVAEINNTPWREQHCYVLDRSRDEGDGAKHRWRLAKDFHISPFMGMNVRYDWRFVDPSDALVVHMESAEDGRHLFDATMTLRRREITGASLAGALVRYPFASARVVAAIYWQALRLKLKKVPFHEHPRWKTQASTSTR